MSRYLEIVNLGGDHYLFPFDEISHVKLRSNEIVSIILKTGEIINTRESSENIRFLMQFIIFGWNNKIAKKQNMA